jgi:hypothetical protein
MRVQTTTWCRNLLVAFAICLSLTAPAADEPVRGIPLKPDPPFAVDGDLAEWSTVPGAIALDRAEQVVWGGGSWTSPTDLSATVQVAWRQEFLFVAVAVTDDQLRQTQRGDGLWKGDHLELYVDAQPDLAPERTGFGDGQFQFALSPGNFLKTGDPLTDCGPELYCYRPEKGAVEGALVGATRTATGWTLEAAIPWAFLGVPSPAAGLPLRLEIGVSDTDSPEPRQEALMTTSTAKWEHTRARLALAALAGSDGVASARPSKVPITDRVVLGRGASQAFTFALPAVPAGRDAVVAFSARLDYPKVAGYTAALRLLVNGTPLTAERLANKPQKCLARGGQVYTLIAGERLSIYYSPDLKSPDSDPNYGLMDGVKACDFGLRVTDLVKAGENTLNLENVAVTEVAQELLVEGLRLEFQVPPPPPKPKAGPPVGELPTIEPRPLPDVTFAVQEQPAAVLTLTVGGESFAVQSRFSTPAPGWVQGTSTWFKHERRVESRSEVVVVRDTFTNLTAENLPLMHRHQVRLGERQKGLWLAGLRRPTGEGVSGEPQNPTAFATTAEHGLGLLPLDDVFRVHITDYAAGGDLGIADNALVLKPGATYTAEWAIVPVARPDYWGFLNAARRLTGANFLIDGGFAFLRSDPLTEKWSDAQIRDFVRLKDAHYVCASITYPKYAGETPHGTAFQRLKRDNFKAGRERLRRLVPEAKFLVYFHCFLDVTEDAAERFADARTLRPDGKQADYGKSTQRLFFPTLTNSYGQEIGKSVDLILDEIGADGVYWDEHEQSAYAYHYGEPWDGVSGDIDPATMKLRGLKSSVTLLSEGWRVALAQRIQARGPLVANGAPVTRAMASLNFPCFVETGSITNCCRAQMYSPIALGDHLTERSELDAYRVMLGALDYGCVYHWYNDMTVIPTHPHLTRYMFPITPVELRQGCIIGKERIVTKISGQFGWGDAAAHEVHVFDDTGREVADFQAPQVRRDGKTYTELRLAEDWSAAIVRKQP